jgi:YidC/Oxa1 family membrane protein insertase
LNIWELIIQQPVINILIVMTNYLASNFGLAIIALTIIVNLMMLSLTLSQIRSAKSMQDIQPKMAEIQKKYAKDKQKLAQEQMRLYKEMGVKPAGCLITMVIQMPVWIALYQAIMLALAVAPEGLLNLSKYLYPWPVLYSILPLNRQFLMMDLAEPNFILALLVGVTMWLQQKMSTTTLADPRQAQQNQLMLWMMPMMFAFLALSFPSGLSLYWVTSSVFRIVLQYRVSGWGGLRRQAPKEVEGDKKYLKFDTASEKKSEDKAGADIVTADSDSSKSDDGILKPSKMRYLPGRDRAPRRRKK